MYHTITGRARFDYELLDAAEPFELDDTNIPHLYKHETFSQDDLWDVWAGDPVFIEAFADGHADWLMVAEVATQILVVPLAPADSGDVTKARPIGLYVTRNQDLINRYLELR